MTPTHADRVAAFQSLKPADQRQLVHAILRECSPSVAEARRGTFTDFIATFGMPLGLTTVQRYRLYHRVADAADLVDLADECKAVQQVPSALAPFGLAPEAKVGNEVQVVSAEQMSQLFAASAIVHFSGGRWLVDTNAYQELTDGEDSTLALVNGLLWLRPLARDRLPPALTWCKTPAHELFERCFFLVMGSTFMARGRRWGTKNRGVPGPDGRLSLPNDHMPTLYDCKASREGYTQTYADVVRFSDYLRQPLPGTWDPAAAGPPRFLVVSSAIQAGTRRASFDARQAQLSKRVPGGRLTWVRAPDLVRFGLAIERDDSLAAARESIDWPRILDLGDVHWPAFEAELTRLRMLSSASSRGPA
jgi:hypothetical protein